MTNAIGNRIWAIPEGYIPGWSHGPEQMVSHETFCVLNTGSSEAHLTVTVFFEDRKPAGPFRFTVEAQRTKHFRFNDFSDPEPIPVDTSYASLIESDVPVVVQHTRLDSRQPENALLSTIAYPVSQP
jgi:hypothetical protein